MSSEVQSLKNTLAEGLRENAGWAIFVGIVMIIAGILSLLLPFAAGLAVTAVIGAMLFTGGVVQMLLAFKAGAFGRGLLIFLIGLLGTVAGIYTLMQSDEGRPTNIGSEQRVSVTELVETVAAVAGKQIRIKYVPGPVGVQARNHSNERIYALGWTCKNDLKAGIEQTYPWVREQTEAVLARGESL